MRLVMCGWESGRVDELGSPTAIGNSTFALVTSGARSGAYALSLSKSVSYESAGSGTYVSVSVPGSPAEIYVRIGLKISVAAAHPVYCLRCSDGSTSQIDLILGSAGELSAYRGGTLLGSGGLLQNLWSCIEVHLKVDPSAGVLEVWQDGTLIVSFAGNTQVSSLSRVTQLTPSCQLTAGTVGPCTIVFDDLAVNDTLGSFNSGRAGQGGIVPLFPVADTAQRDFTRSAGADNYALVDDVPPNDDTDYVEASTLNARDLYTVAQLPAGASSITVVQSLGRLRSAGGSGAQAALTIKSSGVTLDGATYALPETYVFRSDLYEADPATGNAWLVGGVNALQVGVTVK
jgi:hypothetical protein